MLRRDDLLPRRPPALLPALLLCWLWAALLGGCAADDAGSMRIERALAVDSASSTFPAGPSQSVSLPDNWARTRPGGGPVWYRVAFALDADATDRPLRALAIDKVCSHFEVHLDGRLLHSSRDGDGGSIAPPCQRPQLITLPPALLTAGTHVIDIQVVGQPLGASSSRHRAGQLSAMTLGWQSELSARHALRSFLGDTLPLALSATLLLIGGFLFALGFVNRHDGHLAYFGALSIGWAMVEGHAGLRLLPGADTTAEFLSAALSPLLTLAAVQFLLRMGHARVTWVGNALWLQCLLMPLTLLLAGPLRLYPLTVAWHAVFALQVLLAAALYLRSEWPRRDRSYRWMAASLVVVVAVGLVEWSTQILGERPVAAQWVRLALPVMLAWAGLALLLHQHSRSLTMTAAGQARLDERIRGTTAEIERNFRHLAELRVEQVTERERKRIAADLHDDLGAKLLTIVHTSESERISTLAREALEEMRLSVRGLTGKPMLLLDALGDWRVEVVLRLSQAGIECEWSSPDGDELPQRLSARAYVQTTRILREATSNIIKHSGASRCTVQCSIVEGDFQLVIQDNGNGIAADVGLRLDRGHGLASMKSRAKQLQGQCLVESAPGFGTVIRLTLPMEHATAAY